ncbi:hypothetical protein [Vibrio owensii]|uniref:hypothetical protein n=1 Tax=Vibrio harveyi group TaxID=717610 RepID=UPI003CC63BCD
MKLPVSYTKDNNILIENTTLNPQPIDESMDLMRRFYGTANYLIPDTPINQFIFDNLGSNLPLESVIEFVKGVIKDTKTQCHLDNHFMIDGTEIIDGDPSEYGSVPVIRFLKSKKNIAHEIAEQIVVLCKKYTTPNDLLSHLTMYCYSLLCECRLHSFMPHNCEHCGEQIQFIYDINTGKLTNAYKRNPCVHDYNADHDHIEVELDFPSGRVLVINGIRDILNAREEDALVGYHSVNSTMSMKKYILSAARNGIGECYMNQCYPDIFYGDNGFKLIYGEDLVAPPGHPNTLSIDIERNWVTFIDLDVLKKIKPDFDISMFEEQVVAIAAGKYKFKMNISQQPEVPVVIEKI